MPIAFSCSSVDLQRGRRLASLWATACPISPGLEMHIGVHSIRGARRG